MRQFVEDDQHRAERRLREAERHVKRQKAVLISFETLGDKIQAQTARERLDTLEKTVMTARETLRQHREKPRSRP
jgi:hypothetical protein